MKIRIEGCTADELSEYSPYLSMERVYEGADPDGDGDMCWITNDEGEGTLAGIPDCVHLPEGAKWVKVQ